MNRTQRPQVIALPAPHFSLLPRLWLLAVAMLCLGSLAVSSARAADTTPWPQLPSPPKAKVAWVGESMRVDGIPMKVMHFDSSVDRTTVVAFYRSYWSGGYPAKPSVRILADATVVGQLHGPFYMTVKVKDAPGAGSTGLIVVSRVLGSRFERSPGEVPVMPGAQINQVVESNDPGRRSREVLMSSSSAAPTVAHYYQAALTNAGWRQVQYTDTPREPRRAPGTFMVFLREHSEIQLSIAGGADGRGSIVAATLVTKDTAPAAF